MSFEKRPPAQCVAVTVRMGTTISTRQYGNYIELYNAALLGLTSLESLNSILFNNTLQGPLLQDRPSVYEVLNPLMFIDMTIERLTAVCLKAVDTGLKKSRKKNLGNLALLVYLLMHHTW